MLALLLLAGCGTPRAPSDVPGEPARFPERLARSVAALGHPGAHRAFQVGPETICAIYRTSPNWITNTARGGSSSNCPITPELADICTRAARACGGGVVALDLFEDPDRGLLVNEVNYTMEFRNSIAPTNVNIPERMVDFCLQVARDGWEHANGWQPGEGPHGASISLADGASV